jgi:hypothetical protein
MKISAPMEDEVNYEAGIYIMRNLMIYIGHRAVLGSCNELGRQGERQVMHTD